MARSRSTSNKTKSDAKQSEVNTQPKQRNWSNIAAWIALAFTIFNSVVLYIQWQDTRIEKTRRITVSLAFHDVVARGPIHPNALAIIIRNPGYQEVAVATMGVRLPDGSHFYLSAKNSPSQIPPGSNFMGYYEKHDLIKLCDQIGARGFDGNVTLVGFCIDGLGAPHESTPLEFDFKAARGMAIRQVAAIARGKSN